jgi:hypothetical protein
MAAATVGFGVLLIVLGLGGYFGTRRVSKTALIPAFIGLPILALGLLAQADVTPRAMISGAVVVAVIGFLGAARGLPGMLRLLTGGSVARPVAVVMQTVMALLCVGYAIAGVVWLATGG